MALPVPVIPHGGYAAVQQYPAGPGRADAVQLEDGRVAVLDHDHGPGQGRQLGRSVAELGRILKVQGKAHQCLDDGAFAG